MFADSFGIFVDEDYPVQNIEISLAPRWAAFVQSHRWHRSQESFVRAGRVHVRLRVRTLPGVPIMGFGRNADIAWGGTNLRAASTDLYDVSHLPPESFETRKVWIKTRFVGTVTFSATTAMAAGRSRTTPITAPRSSRPWPDTWL